MRFHPNATGFLTTDRGTMDTRIFSIIAMFISLRFPVSLCGPQSCPDFTATFVGVKIRQLIYPEMTFFKEDVGFRDDDIRRLKML